MAKKTPPRREPRLKLAGAPSVAFINTAGARPDNRQLGVGRYPELLTWGQRAGLLSAAEAERLRREAAARPAEAEAVYARLAAVRSALFRLFLAIAAGREPAQENLDVVSAALAEAAAASRLAAGETGIVWDWAGEDRGLGLEGMMWPVLLSAAELLTSAAGRPLVRQCAAPGCALFFVDRSPSGRKRWCEMKTCGNRAKSLRYYHAKGKHERNKDWLYS